MSFIEEFEEVAGRCKLLNALLWVLLSLGVIKFTTFFLSFAALLSDLILPSVSLTKYGSNKGAYALVTGASDGIGKEYATQLAGRGFNLLLVSRTLSKLEALKEDLENKYHVDVKVLAMDVSKDASENYVAIKELCKSLPVTVLVNNVGQSHSIPVPFLETKEKELRDIIAINNTATLLITQTVGPIIVSSSKKLGCKGLILTMGSFGGLIPTSLLATYSGSKAFLQNWSAALSAELAQDNVDVECVLSYLVTSAMSKVRKTTFMIPNPRQFVRSTLSSVGRRVGSQSRYATTTPYWSHALFQFLVESTLGVYSRLVIKINHSLHAGIRKRALRKAARQANTVKQD